MNTHNVFINISKSYKTNLVLYFGIACGNLLIGISDDSTTYLNKFRQKNLTCDETERIQTDEDAAVYGAKSNIGNRIWYSTFWPIYLTTNLLTTFVPFVVLQLNPK
jgi:hypothetical protein